MGAIELQGIKLTLWDLGGAEGLRSIWTNYYKSANALIWVVDGSDTSRIEKSKSVFGTSAIISILHVKSIANIIHNRGVSRRRYIRAHTNRSCR